LVKLPSERRKDYLDKGISSINVAKIISNKDLSDFLESVLSLDIDFKVASNILTGDIASYLNKNNISIFDTKFDNSKFVSIVNALSKKEISSKIFKDILPSIMEEDLDIDKLIDENKQVDNKDEALKIVLDVIENYPDSVNDYRNGKENAIKFLMGMVMKNSKGKINPSLAMEILRDNLNK